MRRRSATYVARALIDWYHAGHRDLPWRHTANPYRIWVSEIMLQQTRSQTVVPYYERFLARFPSVESLAAAPEADVLALWGGLGYYSRARNLRKAAQQVAAAGRFPHDYDGLRALPGIGDYTAAAIASIAFGLPHAVVDGNVLRVVARVENDAADIGAPRTRHRFRETAQAWLGSADPAAFNQSLMELGATICVPRNPRCLACPLTALCLARQEGTAGQLPVKLPSTEPVQITTAVVIVERGLEILLRRRADKERRMAGFWELPAPSDLYELKMEAPIGEFRHSITHHRYRVVVYRLQASQHLALPTDSQWFGRSSLEQVPLSTITRKGLLLAERNCPL